MYACARAAVIAAILGIAPGAIAAAPAVISVDAKQMQSLGIETMPLSGASQGSQRSLPAQVVIPNAQIRIVAAPLSGLVQTMAVAPNDPVRQGQLLARLQSPMLIEAQREFLQAATEAQLAQDSLKRDEQLFKEGIIAEGRYQATRARHAQAAAVSSQQRQSLRLYGMGDAAINSLQAGRGMNSTLDIVAPISGVVLEQMASTGQRAEAATPLYRLAQVQPLWLEMRATPAAAAGIAPGAAVSVDGAMGKVLSLGRHLDPATQTVMIRAEISQGAEKLRAGQYVEALVKASEDEARQWQVPATALARHQGKTYVFVVTRGGFVASAVRVLGEAASSATITGNLRGNERIAVKGIAALKAIWTGGSE
jgi:RND family efflux transporter MFP subunit